MSRSVLIISRLQKIDKKNQIYQYFFHFNGFYFGNKINKILFESHKVYPLEIKEDYMVFGKVLKIELNCMYAKIVKMRII